ncbi:MAG: hypothetical protein IJ184_01495 [Alphaproteobacteria bacterium]|nr:hypothetical protein [Alphaproteobacteria bacterium]
MIIKVLIYALIIIFSYFLGYANSKVITLEKQVEVIKYVHTKQNRILSAPHAAKPELLELMRGGLL